MTAVAPAITKLDLAPQRATFALEFVDPIRGEIVAQGLRVSAEGMRPATLTPSNRFAWLDRDPPADRRIRVQAVSTNGMFAPFDEEIEVPANRPDVAVSRLIFRRTLRPTRLYRPPDGMTAVAGTVIDGDGSAEPATDVAVRIHFRYAEELETFSGEPAYADGEGGFVAVVSKLGDIRPDADPRHPGFFTAWLSLERRGETRVGLPLSLRHGRLTRIGVPLEWAALRPADAEDEEWGE